MGGCASAEVSPVENIEREDEESKTGEKSSNKDFGQYDDNQIKKETQLDENETSRRNEGFLDHISSSDLVAKTEEGGIRNHDGEKTENIDHDQIRLINDDLIDLLKVLSYDSMFFLSLFVDFSNTSGNFREKSLDEKASTEITFERKDDFTAIDQHALSAPEEVKASFSTLASYLLEPANSDSEKARVIYTWIADNIRYDFEGLLCGQYGETDAESVLKSGTSVCAGYANLFKALCTFACLDAKVIPGFSKASGYSPENPFTPMTKTDHAWNVVCIDGQWHFVECTWGAGYRGKDNTFQKKFEPFYFFTEPKHFIIEHFPWKSDEEGFSYLWQLLDNPISLDTYNKALKLEVSAMMWNIFPLTHKESIVEAHEEIVIEIGDKDEVLCSTSSKLYDMKSELSYNEFIFLRQERPGVFSISIRPPSNGKYKLTIYGKVDKSEETYQPLMTYLIRFSDVSQKFGPYPQNKGQMWGMDLMAFDNGFLKTEQNQVPIKIVSGDGFLDRTFATTRSVPTLASIIPATKTLSLSEEIKYCLVTATQTSLNIRACFPDTDLYKLELMCKKVDEDDKYYSMACFLIECTKPADPCLGYPTAYPEAVTFCCKLIEPLSAQLPANTAVTCRFRSPLVVKAMVSYMHTKMTQDGDEWSCTVTTPNSGTNFVICGNVDDASSNSFCGLFQYDII